VQEKIGEEKIMNTRTEQIAQVCHDSNKVYCESIGDLSQSFWAFAPEWQKDSAIKGVQFHMEHLTRGENPSPSASHESWLAEKRADGWKYGPIKDPDKKEHPCFLPYHELPVEQRLKDYIFSAIVKAFWDANRESDEKATSA
jgi:hypothetical protein